MVRGVLIDRYLVPGLVAGLNEAGEAGDPSVPANALTVKYSSQPASIGTGRAKDLAVNAVLPFLHAHYGPQAEQHYLSLFQKFPRLQANEVEREITAELLPAEWHVQVNNARRQQGLLHLASLLRRSNPRTADENA